MEFDESHEKIQTNRNPIERRMTEDLQMMVDDEVFADIAKFFGKQHELEQHRLIKIDPAHPPTATMLSRWSDYLYSHRVPAIDIDEKFSEMQKN